MNSFKQFYKRIKNRLNNVFVNFTKITEQLCSSSMRNIKKSFKSSYIIKFLLICERFLRSKVIFPMFEAFFCFFILFSYKTGMSVLKNLSEYDQIARATPRSKNTFFKFWPDSDHNFDCNYDFLMVIFMLKR